MLRIHVQQFLKFEKGENGEAYNIDSEYFKILKKKF